MTASRPIEIIGGGLAGLSLGLALRRAGIRVTIIEAGSYPRHRVCGEFITGLSATTRSRLGLDPFLSDAVENRDVAWYLLNKPVRYQKLPQIAPGLSRYALDARLANAFVAAGGDLKTLTRSAHTRDAPGRVFATGRRRASSGWLGLKIHARDLALSRDLEIHLGDHAYVGLTHVEEGCVNICGLFRRRNLAAKGPDLLLGYLEDCGLADLSRRLRAATLATESFSAVAAVAFDPRVQPPTAVRLGDSLAMIPPFTGHGMAMAFQSAETALASLIAYAQGEIEWPAARVQIHRQLQRRFRIRLASASALHSFLFKPSRQRWLSALNRARLLPLRPLYAALH
ncbi:MAG: FAD-dependent monooxygenase [Opitutus sp.]